jgi:hypothetical protein
LSYVYIQFLSWRTQAGFAYFLAFKHIEALLWVDVMEFRGVARILKGGSFSQKSRIFKVIFNYLWLYTVSPGFIGRPALAYPTGKPIGIIKLSCSTLSVWCVVSVSQISLGLQSQFPKPFNAVVRSCRSEIHSRIGCRNFSYLDFSSPVTWIYCDFWISRKLNTPMFDWLFLPLEFLSRLSRPHCQFDVFYRSINHSFDDKSRLFRQFRNLSTLTGIKAHWK